jgi:EAL domain-containing protein (putative c-di-GMP-specific phosphodiesterase class I)/DNA-binding NarL/FixJ family response regulator
MQSATWKVLIADDDPVVLALVSALLEGEADFAIVAKATDAVTAITAAERCKPDLALLDVSMPGGGGAAAAAGIHDRSPRTKIVALSGSDDVATVRGMLDVGVNRYAVKGMPTDELLAMLRSLMADAVEDPVVATPAGRVRPVGGAVGVLAAMSDANALMGLASVVMADPELELVGLAQSAAHAGTLAARHRPAVALVDAGLEAGGGDRATALIRSASPGTAVIALWSGRDRSQLLGMIRSGARGHLARPSVDTVAHAIRDVADGGVSLDPGLAAVLVEELVARLDERPGASAPAGLGERLDRATRGEGMVTLVQPIVNLQHRGVVGHEALTRFSLSPRQSPDVWFAEAAAIGRGTDLELVAAERALTVLPSLPHESWLSVNVSPEVAAMHEFSSLIDDEVAPRVVVEMTEHAPVYDYDALTEALGPLRERGVRVAVDDAGAGFASLRHILLLRPDFIKLDISLSRGVGQDDARRAMARALVGFASETGAVVIAEGLESQADVTALRLLDVPLGQGYELGRPAPLAGIGEG